MTLIYLKPAALLFTALLLFTHASLALASNTALQPQLDDLPPELHGLIVEIRQTPNPQIMVYNLNPEPLTILDDSEQAFLRLDSLGIHADFAKPAFHQTRYAQPRSLPNNANGPARWRDISVAPAWAWFDARLRSSAATDRGDTWRIPVTLGEKHSSISGRFVQKTSNDGIFQAQIETPTLGGVKNLSIHPLAGERPGVFIHNRGNAQFYVPGMNGEPFLRFLPGKVMINRSSATWQASAPTHTLVPYAPASGGETEWTVMSSVGGFGWADPRVQSQSKGESKTWSIPLDFGGNTQVIQGNTEWHSFADD